MTTRWYVSVLSDVTVKGSEVFVGLTWRLITSKSLFVDCVEATYEQEAFVNHLLDIITSVVKHFNFHVADTCFKCKTKLDLGYYWVKEKNYRKEKARRKDIKHLKNREEQNIYK